MARFIINTTGTLDPVIFYDLGYRTFYTASTVNLDLTNEYTLYEISNSFDIQNSINNGWITAKDEFGNPIYSSVTVDITTLSSGNNMNLSGSTFDPTINLNNNIFLNSVSSNTLSSTTIFSGTSNLYNIFQTPGNDFVQNVITVGTGGFVDFTSIAAAVNSVTGNSMNNPFLINVGPGTYYENTIKMKPFVKIQGAGNGQTVINPSNPSNIIILGTYSSAISDVSLSGASNSTGAAIYFSGGAPVSVFSIENILFEANYTQCIVSAYSPTVILTSQNCSFGLHNYFNDGYVIGSVSGNIAKTNINLSKYQNVLSPAINRFFDISGVGNIVNITDSQLIGSADNDCFVISNGAIVSIADCLISGFTNGVRTLSGGTAPSVKINGMVFENLSKNLLIEHTGTTGYFVGFSEYNKTIIPDSAPFFITNKDSHVITVAKKGADFTSISDACNFITAATVDNPYEISVGPGIFIEPEIFVPGYVDVVGSSIETTIVVPDGNHNIFHLKNPIVELSFMNVSGATLGNAGIFVDDIGAFAQAHKLTFNNCDINVLVKSVSKDTYFYGEYIDYNGTYSYGTKVISTNGFIAFSNLENYYNFPSISGTTGTYASGNDAKIDVITSWHDTTSNGSGPLGGTSFYVENGATLNVIATYIKGWEIGIHSANVGSASNIVATSVINSINTLYDLFIEHPNTTGAFQGVANIDNKVSIPTTSLFNINIQDSEEGTLTVSNSLNIRYGNGTVTDISTLIGEGSTSGVLEGGELSVGTGFTVNIGDGYGYFEQFPDNDVEQRHDWSGTSITLTANVDKYIFFNSNAILTSDSSKPDVRYNIVLGRVVTNSTTIELIDASFSNAEHTSNLISNTLKNAVGPIYSFGSLVSENIIPFNLNISSGTYYYGENVFSPTGGTAVTFTQLYRDGLGGFNSTATTFVDNTHFDNGSGTLTGLTTGYYVKHSLYVVGDGSNEKYYLIIGDNQYSNLLDAQQANIPSKPGYLRDSVSLISGIIIQQGISNIVQIRDLRPVVGFKSEGVNASADHLALLNLNTGDAGHHQFLLLNGSTPMTGSLNMNGNAVYSASTYNNVIVESHSSRHLPNGADPLSSGTPVSLSNVNFIGIQNSFARSDHQHAHDPQSGGTLHSVATDSLAGFISASDKTYLDSIPNIFNTKASLSGATFSGNVNIGVLSAVTLSASTYISGSTDLYNIFAQIGGEVTSVQNGTNTYTGGTSTSPTVNVSALTINTLTVSGNTSVQGLTATTLSATTLSASTMISGSTNLYNIFQSQGTSVLNVNAGSNITTGGTAQSPVVNLTSSPSINGLTTSGATLHNGTLTVTGNTSVQGLTATTLSATTLSANTLFGTTLSASTMISGSTNLYNIFAQIGGEVTSVQNGTNTYTGGTSTSPTVNVSALTINTLTVSGATLINSTLTVTGSTSLKSLTATSITATTLSANTIYSGSTNLDSLFTHQAGYLFQKAGTVSGSTFSGNPKKSTVSFTNNFADTNFAISVIGDTNRTWSVESIATSGFTINANANGAFNSGNVYWIAIQNGEGTK